MNKNLQDIDRLFLHALRDHTEQPSMNTWRAIENELNKRDAAVYKRKYITLRRILICTIGTCLFLSISYVLQFDLHSSLKKQTGNTDPFVANVPVVKGNGIDLSKAPPAYAVTPGKFLQERMLAKAAMLNRQAHQNGNVQFSSVHVPGERREPYYDPPDLTTVKPGLNYLWFPRSQHDLRPGIVAENNNQSTVSAIKDKKPGHSFYLVPYFSFDHVTARFKQVYEPDDDMLPDARKEKLDPSYTTGIFLEYELSKKISLQSALLYSHWFTSISPAVVKALEDNSGSYKFKLATDYGFAEIKQSGFTTPQSGDSVIVSDGVLNSQSVSMPVLLKVNFKPGKLNINGMAGGAINRMTRVVAEVEYAAANNKESETAEKLEGLKKTYFTVIAGAEATYPVNQTISVGINPVVRYAITPVNKGTPVKTYPISIGVGASVRINLK